MAKTLFFGGTFNPPHISHRLMLEAVAEISDIERVLVVPTNIPPHKEFKGFTASGEDRLNMCRLLCDGIEKAQVSDMELKRGGRSYSFDTLTALKPQYPSLYMLIGADMITTFTGWYRYQDILDLCGILAVRRKGVDDAQFDESIEHLRSIGGKIEVVEVDLPEISSTEIRDLLENSSAKALQIPRNVLDYIEAKELYRGEQNDG